MNNTTSFFTLPEPINTFTIVKNTKITIEIKKTRKIFVNDDINKSSSRCIHKKNKYVCTDCRPELLCEHEKNIKRCTKCNKSLLCVEHGKYKYRCMKCNKNLLCSHNIHKYKCDICKPRSKCKHNRNVNTCCKCEYSRRKKEISNIRQSQIVNTNSDVFCKHNILGGNCNLCYSELANSIEEEIDIIDNNERELIRSLFGDIVL